MAATITAVSTTNLMPEDRILLAILQVATTALAWQLRGRWCYTTRRLGRVLHETQPRAGKRKVVGSRKKALDPTYGARPLRLGSAAVFLHVAEAAQQIVARTDRLVSRRIVGGLAGRQAGDRRAIVEIEKSGDRVTLLSGPVDDTVEVRAVDVVGPALEQVADIDDERPGDERRADPFAVALPELEAADRILRKERDHAVVGMRRDAECLVVGHRRLRWVMEQSHLHHRLGAERQEIVARHVEADRKGAQQALAEIDGVREIGFRRLAQPRTFLRPAVGTVERQARDHVGIGERKIDADLVALLEIGREARVLVDALRHEAAPETLVHAVGETLCLRQIEIAPRRREHALADRRGDAVVGDIEEADGFAGVAQLLRQRRKIAIGTQSPE